MHATRRRIIRNWSDRTTAVTITTIHPQHGPIRRGVLRLHRGVWEIVDGEGFYLGKVNGDYLTAELSLFEQTPALDELDPAEPVTLTPTRLRAAGVEAVTAGLFRRLPTTAKPARPGYDPNPTLCLPPGGSHADFYGRYAAGLDDWAPGWHRDDLTRMAPGLAHEAQLRRDNDNR